MLEVHKSTLEYTTNEPKRRKMATGFAFGETTHMARYAKNPTFRFPHHTLAEDEVPGPHKLVSSVEVKPVLDPSCHDMPQVAECLRENSVRRVYLLHGTFAGNDIGGIVREVARFSPVSARRLKEIARSWVDELAGEIGNYTAGYAERLSQMLHSDVASPIQVERFGWSGENHHLGRCDGALALLNKWRTESIDGRVLVFAHSHGGNLMAMLSLLVGASDELKKSFFEATRMHYHSVLRGKVDLQFWEEIRDAILDPNYRCPPIDVVTFGTPLRYRWNRNVCPKLLHVVQHRSTIDAEPARAAVPKSIPDVTQAVAGDFVQQLGIGGTDFLPPIYAWRDWVVERRLAWLFESTVKRRDLWTKIKQGRRESCDGETLLVDYPATEGKLNQKLFGHGVYTCHEWLPFHLNQVCDHFYRNSENG